MSVVAVTATGVFQRRKGKLTNSLLDLHNRLATLPGVEAIHCKHTDNAQTVANRIAHEIDATNVFVTGHSAGGGFCCDLSADLDEFGVSVDGMVLADPFHLGGVFVPSNVLRLWTYRKKHKHVIDGWDIQLASEDIAEGTAWVIDDRDVSEKHWKIDEYAVQQGVLWRLVQEALA